MTTANAGGLLHNTNQHIDFMRMMARGASTEIDAIYTNPAGIGFMEHNGWGLSINIQNATQNRDIEATFPLFPDENHTRYYEGKAVAPIIPSIYAVYKAERWSVAGFFGITGGGGKCNYDKGLPLFDAAIMAGLYSANSALTPDVYNINTSMRGRQYIYGAQVGGTYLFNKHFSGYVGFRMNYFDGNYRGHVDAALKNGDVALAHIALDCDQTGWGITPIIGLDYKWDRLTLAAKFEFKTKLNIENDTKQLEASPEAFRAALTDFEHGVNTPSDLPSVLYLAAGYEIIPKKLRAAVEYHFYDDRHAGMAHDKQKALRHGTHEILAGVEWDITKMFTVSAGFQNTDYGLTDEFQTNTSFSCDSYSIGLGGAINITPKIKVNLGYFWTTYKDYNKTMGADKGGYNGISAALPGKDVYSRTNRVFGAGIDFKF